MLINTPVESASVDDWRSDTLGPNRSTTPSSTSDSVEMRLETSKRTKSAAMRPNSREHRAHCHVLNREIQETATLRNAGALYVRAMADQAQRLISTRGGFQPLWRRDGKELIYFSFVVGLGPQRLVALEVNGNGATFKAGTPKLLFDTPILSNPAGNGGIPFQAYVQPFTCSKRTDEPCDRLEIPRVFRSS